MATPSPLLPIPASLQGGLVRSRNQYVVPTGANAYHRLLVAINSAGHHGHVGAAGLP